MLGGMKSHRMLSLGLVVLGLLGFAPSRVAAQLPMLEEEGWLGYFAGLTESRFLFGIDSQGLIIINPNVKAKGPSDNMAIKIEPLVIEQMPNGGTTTKNLAVDSLETSDQPTLKFKQAVYRGKVTGDAQFEVTVTSERGMIFAGGRILNPGSLKNPLRFALQVRVPNFYPNLKIEEEDEKKAAKELQKRLRGDQISLKSADGKRQKFDLLEKPDFKQAGLIDGMFTEVEVSAGAIKGRKISIAAAPNSFLKLSPSGSQPTELYKGLQVTWQVDAAKDPDGKARMAVGVR